MDGNKITFEGEMMKAIIVFLFIAILIALAIVIPIGEDKPIPIIQEPEIGSIVELDKRLELYCVGFDLSHVYEGKTLIQKGSCTFMRFTPVIGGNQLIAYTYTLKVNQIIDFGYVKYKFLGFNNGQFQFEAISNK